jgi:hypothetical protein
VSAKLPSHGPRLMIPTTMRLTLPALALLVLFARGASAQLVAAPDANPLGAWRGTSVCVARPSDCTDEVVAYRIALAKSGDSVSVDGRKVVGGREEAMGVLACELNAARAIITCGVPNGKWRFAVRHDSLVGQLRLKDGTWLREVRALRAGDGG